VIYPLVRELAVGAVRISLVTQGDPCTFMVIEL
jgi:hypothetical protein